MADGDVVCSRWSILRGAAKILHPWEPVPALRMYILLLNNFSGSELQRSHYHIIHVFDSCRGPEAGGGGAVRGGARHVALAGEAGPPVTTIVQHFNQVAFLEAQLSQRMGAPTARLQGHKYRLTGYNYRLTGFHGFALIFVEFGFGSDRANKNMYLYQILFLKFHKLAIHKVHNPW